MVMKANGPAAYAPSKTITDLIERFRGAGLPPTLTAESLQRVSVSVSLAPRTLHTLKLLDLVDDLGKPTQQFEGLRRAPTAQFKAELIDLLKSVYADVFEVVEPANATYEQVQDAFRSFTPQGQRDRMVSLFLGLLEYAKYSDSLPSGRASGGTRSAGESPPPRRTSRNGRAASRVPTARPEPSPPPVPTPTPSSSSAGSGYSTEVQLGEAGTVTLIADVNPLLLSKADRDFFYNLVDSIREYESAQTSPTESGAAPVAPTSTPARPSADPPEAAPRHPDALPTAREAIVGVLRAEGRTMSMSEIVARAPEFGATAQSHTIRSLLTKLFQSGVLERPSHGQYRLATPDRGDPEGESSTESTAGSPPDDEVSDPVPDQGVLGWGNPPGAQRGVRTPSVA